MQYDNIIKELEAMRTFLHMGYEMDPHEMKRFIEDITYELRDFKQEVDDEEMYLRDELRDETWMRETLEERFTNAEQWIEWATKEFDIEEDDKYDGNY